MVKEKKLVFFISPVNAAKLFFTYSRHQKNIFAEISLSIQCFVSWKNVSEQRVTKTLYFLIVLSFRRDNNTEVISDNESL